MKSLYFTILFLGSGFVFCNEPDPQLKKIERDIEEIQAACIPKVGTSKASLDKALGQGTPSGEALRKLPLIGEVIAESSPRNDHILDYKVCKNGVLVVHYDKNWKVKEASYVDPFRGPSFSSRQVADDPLTNRKRFLKLMNTIKREYKTKTGRP